MNKIKAKLIKKKVYEKFDGKDIKKFRWTCRQMKKMYKQGKFEI